MIWYLLILGTALLLMLATCVNATLRRVSRARFADLLEGVGLEIPIDRQLQLREQLSEVGAIIRTACVILSTLLLLEVLQNRNPLEYDAPWSLTQEYAAAFVATLLFVLIFGVGLGNAMSRHVGESVVGALLPVIMFLRGALAPLLYLFRVGDSVVRRLTGAPPIGQSSDIGQLEQEILDLVSDGEVHGAVDEDERAMIESVIELRETVVGQIMTPRTGMVAVERQASLQEVRELMATHGHSRLPVYEETIDRVVGVIYAKDLLSLSAGDESKMADLMREPVLVPETKPLKDVLSEFRKRKNHIAIVLDEYGGTAGLITISDILEELVGEIGEEHIKPEAQLIRRIDDFTAEVDARASIYDVNQNLHLELPESDEYETVGGFLFHALGAVPHAGAKFSQDNLAIQVLEAEPRRVKRLLIKREPVMPAAVETP